MQSPVYKARLAGAADPGNANELSERQLKVYILKVMSRRALYFESLAVSFASLLWNFNHFAAGDVVGSQSLCFEHGLRCALEHHLSAFSSCAGAYVHYVVGVFHYIFVMLNDNYRVADVAKLLQRLYKSHVVSLMQSDGRLVKDVKHVDQLRTDLGGQSDALAFSAAQRRG